MAYNGWKNKETWLVNLWLGYTLSMYAEDGVEITPDYIEELVEELVDAEVSQNGLVADLLNCALGEIDYHEIAEHYETEEEDPEGEGDE